MKKTAKNAAKPRTKTKTKNMRTTNARRKGADTTNSRRAVALGEVTGRKAEVIALMKRPEGVTTEQIETATGMKVHSARALISGIAKIETVSKSKDGGEATVYSIKV